MEVTHMGTSPRTRGKPLFQCGSKKCRGNIPAHAGKTSAAADQASQNSEHPRARGENEYEFNDGSHPRARGENSIIHSANYTEVGTSPRTRGKLVVLSCLIHPWGNIPAHAGKTTCRAFEGEQVGEHPRARGENFESVLAVLYLHGTSPRTRGKLLGCKFFV